VRLKEAKKAKDVILCSIGPQKCQEILRTGLAMGADKAVHIDTGSNSEDASALEPLDVAKALKKVVEENGVKMVILGKQAIDDDCAQTGPMLAGLLKWPQATFANKIKVDGDSVEVIREVDGILHH
jgi:electron transfer flavoprotein beta subunit